MRWRHNRPRSRAIAAPEFRWTSCRPSSFRIVQRRSHDATRQTFFCATALEPTSVATSGSQSGVVARERWTFSRSEWLAIKVSAAAAGGAAADRRDPRHDRRNHPSHRTCHRQAQWRCTCWLRRELTAGGSVARPARRLRRFESWFSAHRASDPDGRAVFGPAPEWPRITSKDGPIARQAPRESLREHYGARSSRSEYASIRRRRSARRDAPVRRRHRLPTSTRLCSADCPDRRVNRLDCEYLAAIITRADWRTFAASVFARMQRQHRTSTRTSSSAVRDPVAPTPRSADERCCAIASQRSAIALMPSVGLLEKLDADARRARRRPALGPGADGGGVSSGPEWEKVERPLLDQLASLGWETLIWGEQQPNDRLRSFVGA